MHLSRRRFSVSSKGPAPTPEPLRRLYGVREPTPPPVPAQTSVEPPEGLSEAALVVWRRLGPDLIRKQVVDAWNVDAFGRLCWLTATSAEMRAQIDREGFTVVGVRGKEMVKHKLWPTLRQVDQELVQLESRFGLTPADRSRVRVEDGATSDLLSPERFLS